MNLRAALAGGKRRRNPAGVIDAAHRRGIVYRDLKPAHVLLAADGTPKVSAFGLANTLDAGPGPATGPLTNDFAFVGTPGHMAPERAAGTSKEVGGPTDVYALGAIAAHARGSAGPGTALATFAAGNSLLIAQHNAG